MELKKGANTAISAADGTQLSGLVIGVRWASGDLDCDVCALVCDANRRVVSDQHLVFWNQRESPERAVILRAVTVPDPASPDRAQVLVDLTTLPEAAERIVVVLATVTPGATLLPVSGLRLRVLDAVVGDERASYTFVNDLTGESCLVIGEIYRHQSSWKLRAVGQGFDTGLAGLSTAYGVKLA